MLTIPVIDIFAGPGGLGEGFSALNAKGERPFHIGCSVEMEPNAHATLTLRAFYRQCIRDIGHAPPDYYAYVQGRITRNQLFDHHPEFANIAKCETLDGPRELGPDNELIDHRIKEVLSAHDGPWVLIGGPPCQAYSLAGRSRNKGIKGYKFEDDPKSKLYRQYLRIVDRFSPEIFVMENVKGMLSSKLKGKSVFYRILEDLHQPGLAIGGKGKGPHYRIYSLVVDKQDQFAPTFDPPEFVVRSEDYGIPQTRHRVILLGVREDVSTKGKRLILERPETQGRVSLNQVITGLPRLRSGLSKEPDSYDQWRTALEEAVGDFSRNPGLGVRPELISRMQESVKNLRKPHRDRGANFQPWPGNTNPYGGMPKRLAGWFADEKLGGVLNHDTREHIRQDLARYLYCIAYTKSDHWKRFRSPRLEDFPESLMPNHAEKNRRKFTDRFRVQNPHSPGSTVTSHISKDGHYYIHPDISQVRSLTVREAARIQTFPDNYFFEGGRTRQYEQVGNAVPPFLANQISEIVYGLLS